MLRYGRWVLLVSFKWSAQPNINRPPCEGFFFYRWLAHIVRAVWTRGESSGQTLRP